jgi:hypothetical protein
LIPEEERNIIALEGTVEMSRSRNTEQVGAGAERKIRRDEAGEPCLPRIIARRALRGDEHPLPRSALAKALRTIPLEYLYGLKRIELRPRASKVGEPYAYYEPPTRSIVLYSLPRLWTTDRIFRRERERMESFGAEVTREGHAYRVHWPPESGLAVWFFTDTILHELGHHFAEQYKKKRGLIKGRGFREAHAELHAFRLTRACVKRRKKEPWRTEES